MESGEPFDIGFFTCSKSRGTGGQYITGNQVRLTGKTFDQGGWCRPLFQDGQHRTVHVKLIVELNGELVQ
ncbi:hypothetical protein [Marinoscillum furvescens]|uniref:Uncharacterized protein n=1 Tax=Marinoscillum furvescens DSM 4134 TaxID=1122208 RepID=A0A3D9L513_MARFU|nr:hypothetical protein [Marinoscillum furvescens]REE01113.1 hypothetical protein C7460_104133 [Marinoscillum furvescens DSM 4134]